MEMTKRTQEILTILLAAHPSVQGECTVTGEGFTDGDDGTIYKGRLVEDGNIFYDGCFFGRYIQMGQHNGTEYRFMLGLSDAPSPQERI